VNFLRPASAGHLLAGLLLSIPAILPGQGSPTRGLLPVPRTVEWHQGRLALDSSFRVAVPRADPRLEAAAVRMLERLERHSGVALPRAIGRDSATATLLVAARRAGTAVPSLEEDESYTLDVDAGGALLRSATTVGALRGLETLLQLLEGDREGWFIPAVHIEDAPRFRWRGLLLDVGRHFEPVEVIKRTLDGMAVVKLNVFHWHLSDDQGFRVESRRFPRLASLGSDGQFYTQAQIREIVAYARDRGIRVLPEFDMPGHATSWFAGYPQFASARGPYSVQRSFGVHSAAFDPSRESVYRFLDTFIGEMAPLFPDAYWHVGGDEVEDFQWNASAQIRTFRRRHRLPDNAALQAYFNRRLSAILARHGKRMVGWDEILHPDLPHTAAVQSWRGPEYLAEAVRQGHPALLSAGYYLDHIDAAEEHYLADPLPSDSGLSAAERDLVLGGEACMWGEHVGPETVDSRLWPRLAAVAERLWSPRTVTDIDDLYRRLTVTSVGLEQVGTTQGTHLFRMARRIAAPADLSVVGSLLELVQPADFGQRVRLQGTTQLTPLVRMVDAARPDPPARRSWRKMAERVAADPHAAGLTADSLRVAFGQWQLFLPAIEQAAGRSPLVADGLPAAQTLGDLGRLGQDALTRLMRDQPPDTAWTAAARAQLDSARGPQGLLRVVLVDAVEVLVEAISQKP
jgi:hexosaminidase